MSRRKVKKELQAILGQDDLQSIFSAVKKYRATDVIHHLFSTLCSYSEKERWHAVSLFGKVIPALAKSDMERARIVMRRLLWSLNDESGGIGWGAPEAMAEIMVHDTRLAAEYLHMLISYMREDGPELFQDGNYLEHPLLQRGLLWGIGRLCEVEPELMRSKNIIPDLKEYLDSEDYVVSGLAIRCLAFLQDEDSVEEVQNKVGCMASCSIYADGFLRCTTVDEIAKQYLERIEGN